MRVLVALCLAVVSAASANLKALPPGWKKCARDDPNIRECFREAIEVAITELSKKGARRLGVFPIDPLFLSRIEIKHDNGPFSVNIQYSDVNIHGFKNIKVLEVIRADIDIDNFNFQVLAQMKEGVVLKGHFKMDGAWWPAGALAIPVTGEGKCEVILENLTGQVGLYGKELIKNGIKYLNVTDYNFTFDTTRLRMNFDDQGTVNKDMGNQLNAVINENWNQILQEMKPAVETAFGSAFREISNRIFKKVPYDTIFPQHM